MINKEQITEFAIFFIKNNSTIRKTAAFFNISKSSMHNYLHKKLKKINYSLFCSVEKILTINKLEKHIRGGQSTKTKYKIQNKKTF